MKIEEIEGVGPANGATLQAAGVSTTEALLKEAGTRRGREKLAAATGIPASSLLEWVNRADLMRINGVGSEYSDLLEAAGVDSPTELARRNPTNLASTFQELVAKKPTLVRRVPSESIIAAWIDQARNLPKIIEY